MKLGIGSGVGRGWRWLAVNREDGLVDGEAGGDGLDRVVDQVGGGEDGGEGLGASGEDSACRLVIGEAAADAGGGVDAGAAADGRCSRRSTGWVQVMV